PAPAVPPTRLRASPALPLIGRDGTLEVLRAHLEAARGGSGKTVLVSGEAGIGKSRLLSELLSGAAADVRVLSAGCHETSRDMAFQPLIEALRAAVRPAEFATLGLPPLLWQQLCRLLPELSAATASISDVSPPAPALPGWARGQLFEALARVLVALALRCTTCTMPMKRRCSSWPIWTAAWPASASWSSARTATTRPGGCFARRSASWHARGSWPRCCSNGSAPMRPSGSWRSWPAGIRTVSHSGACSTRRVLATPYSSPRCCTASARPASCGMTRKGT
ncbi:MAG: ATP-binding protein, partial [Chloroflexi bacterium]|nr:ATP-binding protein [Chloroflexota bacterium]